MTRGRLDRVLASEGKRSAGGCKPAPAPSANGVHRPAADAPVAAGSPDVQLVTRRASDFAPAEVDWLWPGYLPLGMVAELIGDPGDGKSTLTADVAARVSTGRPFPGGSAARPPADVLYLNAEDSPAHTTVPRLLAAGADLGRVNVFDCVRRGDASGPLVLPAHFAAVEAAAGRVSARLIVADPLNAFLGPEVDSHTDADVRARVMYPFKELAEATGAAVLLVRHLNKGAGKAVYRAGGSIGFTAAVRVSLAVGRLPDDRDRRALACVKCNVGREPPTRGFQISTNWVPEVGDVGVACWGAELPLTAGELLAPPPVPDRPDTRRADCEVLLRKLLADGPRPAAECQQACEAAGFTDGTVTRAKRATGVKSHKQGFQGWVWRFASEGADPSGSRGPAG